MSAGAGGPTIVAVDAMTILDSRGSPTLRAFTRLSDGSLGVASAPSGKSTGKRERLDLRDGGREFAGRGVQNAIDNVRGPISLTLCGQGVSDPVAIDRALVELDGTPDRSYLGANATVAVSMSVWRALAQSNREPLWKTLAQNPPAGLPVPLFNVINGGAHAKGGLQLQEFMLVPHGLPTTRDRIRCGSEVYAELRACFAEAGMSTAVGDEGGFVYTGQRVKDAITMLCAAIERSGYCVGEEVALAIDAAANGFRNQDGTYSPEVGRRLSSEEMCDWWCELVEDAPVVMLEDPLDEDDVKGWELLTRRLESHVTIVGDDIFVTDPARIRWAVHEGIANAVLLKPNQIGTVSETIQAWQEARRAGYKTVVSHRSGETCDAFISDLAVGIGSDYLKAGALARSERTEKYNRLLEIEREMRVS
ncbi:MAG TPA: phosphopyruvate hydratase [Candidatus Acidoferrales bacterium]|nr:phosphopyruvate hydratase [Candidatus Acidoferrales bacterium]